MPYNENSEYNKYLQSNSGSSSDDSNCCGDSDPDCGCCPIGTVAVYNEDGSHAGCLTPNDAEIYNNALINPEEGYVKTFHPVTGAYLGSMSVDASIRLLEFLNNGTVPASNQEDFNTVMPELDPSGYVELSYLVADAETSDIDLVVDRIGVSEAISLAIVNTIDDIQFGIGGLASLVPVNDSSKTIKFKWTGLVAGTYLFTLRYSTTNIVKNVEYRLTLS